MSELDHWHPVLKSGELRGRPVGVRVAGRELVVFRAGRGIGALADRCPHRGGRLSLGKVDDGTVVCPYHAWRWGPDGTGTSPGNPRLRPCTERFDAVERLGAIWVKRAGAPAAFPRVDTEGWFEIGRLRHVAPAPLEVTLDNFTEIEHTGPVHLLLGYEAERMAEVESKTTIEDDRVRVYNAGPTRPLPAVVRALYRLPADSWFVDDWTTFFSPVHTIYEQYWIDPHTRECVSDALRVAVFFNPRGPAETELFTFAYTDAQPWSRGGLNGALLPLTRILVDLEVRRDMRMLGLLADASPSIEDNRLGRFDKGLMAARRRIDAIYRGMSAKESSLVRGRASALKLPTDA
jgi:vanillate O-demethylase monooxygenase subunit